MVLGAIADITRLRVLEVRKRYPLEKMEEEILALPKREFSFE